MFFFSFIYRAASVAYLFDYHSFGFVCAIIIILAEIVVFDEENSSYILSVILFYLIMRL